MTDDAIPEADAYEQKLPLLDPDPDLDLEAPRIDDETPEADALEQSIPVPVDDDEDRR
jgi:hypothetical protein